jgi:hypothetical protein
MFDDSPCQTATKLANFSKYVRRQNLARFLVQYELFKKQLHVKGNVVECGVHHGGGVMAWAKISSILEPYNYRRTIVGFDTFEGFPSVSDVDVQGRDVKAGMFAENYDVYEELTSAIREHDDNRFLNHIPKVELVKGDACQMIPAYLDKQKHFLVSLLYLDFDIYEPTAVALECFLPRMPKGAVLAFDQVNNAHWPGETVAMLDKLKLNTCSLRCFECEPNISYIVL